MRRPLIAGNWKMYKDVVSAKELVQGLKDSLKGVEDRDILVVPPFTFIYPCYEILKDSPIYLGAQDMY